MPAGNQIDRPRLLDLARDARVVVLAAGGGYGKTAFAAQLADDVEAVPVRVRPRGELATSADLLGELRQALGRVGLWEVEEIVAATEADPSGLADALHDGLCQVEDRVMLIVDDAHLLGRAAVDLLAQAVTELPDPHQAVVCTRWAPEVLEGVAACVIRTDELAFTDEEILSLAVSYGLELSRYDAAALRRATGGWAAALRMLLPSLGAAPALPVAVERATQEPATVATLTERLWQRLEPELQSAAVQLAHLPLLDNALAERAVGRQGVLDELATAGLPLTPARHGWWVMADPVREQLVRRGGLTPSVAGAAADVYEQREERRVALRVLLRAGDEESAIDRAGEWPNHVAVRLGVEPLRQLCGSVSDAVLRRDPRVLIHLSVACGHANDVEGRIGALDRAAVLAPDGPMADEVEAERVLAELWLGRVDDACPRAEALLGRVGADRPVVYAKALMAVARCEAWERDPPGLRRADARLAEAMGIWERLGETALYAQTALLRGLLVAWPLGQHDEAVSLLDTCLAQARLRSRQRAQALPFKAFVLTSAGRHDEADRCLDEAIHLAGRLRDGTVRLYASWGRAHVASHRGDSQATRAALQTAVREGGSSPPDTAGGAYLLADGAQLLDRVGHTDEAWAWLERAQRAGGDQLGMVPLAAFALHARSGDPDAAERHLAAALDGPGVEPRDVWRVALLRAEAARRRGEEREATRLAREAFDLARTTDVPDAPWIREHELSERLAVLTSSDDPAEQPATSVQLLDGFAVRRGAEDITPPPGRLAAVVKLVALRGGRATAEQVITSLWPDADPKSGRARLRQLLARLRRVAGDLVVRDGDVLQLPDGTGIDHAEFLAAAHEALTARGHAVEQARVAVNLAGELLPEDAAEDWAIEPREDVRRLRLALLDGLADMTARTGDVDEAVHLLDEAASLEPAEADDRLHRAAALMDSCGRASRARALRARAASVAAS